MTKVLTSAVILATALAASAAAYADSPPAQPQPPAAIARLAGNWKLAGTFTLGKDVAKVNAVWACKATSQKFGVVCTLHVTGIPGGYDETNLFGFDPESGTYHWYTVSNMGETHDHVAKEFPADKVRFVYTGTQGGQPASETLELTFDAGGKLVSGKGETTVGGAVVSALAMAVHR